MQGRTIKRELLISSFSDDDIETLLYSSTLFANVLGHAEEDVMLRFKGGYISPAFAVPLMAAVDELGLQGHAVSFSLREMQETYEMAEFFAHSGIHTSMREDNKRLIENVLAEMRIPRQSIWTKEVHKISLSDIRDGVEGKEQLGRDAVSLILPVYIERSESDIFKSMVTNMCELFDNALTHGSGEYIYSIAKKARDGDNLIVVYDNGKGIPGAYKEYQYSLPTERREERSDQDTIEWAFRKGTSTKQAQKGSPIPRGIGLPSLRENIGRYQGELGIASGNAICYSKKQVLNYKTIDTGLKGTMLILKVPSSERI